MRLLIIDDQPAVRDLVKSQVKAERLGLKKVDTAGSAEEARKKIIEEEYEIILCDIEMPGENGISFARWLLTENPRIKLIFLTSHMDFDYMKQAISMHSFDYVLQPANSDEINMVVQKAIFEIQIEQQQSLLMKKGEKYTQKEHDLIAWNIYRYVNEDIPIDHDVRESLEHFHPEVKTMTNALLVEVCLLDQDNKIEELGTEMAEFVFENILDELLENNKLKALFLKKRPGIYDGIIHSEKADTDISVIRQAIHALQDYISCLFKTESMIYFSGFFAREKLQKQWKLFQSIIQVQGTPKHGILYVQEKKNETHNGDSLKNHTERWIRLLNQQNYDELESTFIRYVEHRASSTLFTVGDAATIHAKFSEILFVYLAENNISTEKIFSEKMSYSDYMMLHLSKENLISAVSEITDRLRELHETPVNPVEQITYYIRQNIKEDISVTDMAEYVRLSPEHLTRVFKKETGYSLKEYLTHEKLEVAKMLLRTTPMNVTMVAMHVGYDNYNNFTKIFRKYEGVTPSEYRKMLEEDM